MGRPEKYLAERIESLLHTLSQEGKIESGKTYSRADLLDLFRDEGVAADDVDGLFMKFRSLAQDEGAIGQIGVSYEGTRRGRRYGFGDLEEPEDQVSQSEHPQPIDAVGIDHPEDRAHIATHVAMLLVRRCVGISMPNVSGARTRGNTAHSNPDFIGVAIGRKFPPLGTLQVPQWVEATPASERDQMVAAEIKPSITSSGELSSAIRQARHNCRYFDEAWLVAQVARSLANEASELGEEYNVGVISADPEAVTRPEVLWTPRPTNNRATVREFLARYDQDSLKQIFARIGRCREIAESLTERRREQVLLQLLTDQRADSLVTRLPQTIQDSLRQETFSPVEERDVDSFAAAVRSALFDAFEYDAPEESNPGDYLAQLNLLFLLDGAGIVSRAVRGRTKSTLLAFIDQRMSEMSGFRARLVG